jgi:hypothetical protein
MTGTVNAGYTVQLTTRGLLWWDIPTNAVKFADSQGIWHTGDAGLSLTRWEMLGVAPAPPGDPPAWSQPMPAAPQAPVAPRGPDPALVSQCMAVADDLTRTMGMDDPRVYFGLLGECERAVASHGVRGLQCFEIAWRPMARILPRTKPGSRAAFNAIEDAYQRCVSTR